MQTLAPDLVDFFRLGLAVFSPDETMEDWLISASAAIQSCTYSEDEEGWKSAHRQPIPFPSHARLRHFISSTLARHSLPTHAQVAVVNPGYPTGSNPYLREMFKRHVDGAQSANTLDWAQALVGVLVTDLPSADRGNPVHWLGSHFLTEMRMQHLATHDAAAAAAAIHAGLTLPASYQPTQLLGKAGTVFVVHHALHHGIAPNLSSDERQVVYYRIKVDGAIDAPWMLWNGYQAFL